MSAGASKQLLLAAKTVTYSKLPCMLSSANLIDKLCRPWADRTQPALCVVSECERAKAALENIPTSLYESVGEPELHQYLDTCAKPALQHTAAHTLASSQPAPVPPQPVPTPMNSSPGPPCAPAPAQAHLQHGTHSQPFSGGEWRGSILIGGGFYRGGERFIGFRLHCGLSAGLPVARLGKAIRRGGR